MFVYEGAGLRVEWGLRGKVEYSPVGVAPIPLGKARLPALRRRYCSLPRGATGDARVALVAPLGY